MALDFNPTATASGGLASTFSKTAIPSPTPDTGQVPFSDAKNPTPAPAPIPAPVNQLINTSSKSRTTFSNNSSDLAAALAKISGAPTQENPNPQGTSGSGTGSDNNTGTGTTGVDTNGIPLNDPIMTGLTQLQTNSDAATKSLIASTIASYQTQRNALTSQYENYKRGLQQLGVETGAAQSTPDLLAGHILQAGNDELTKINDLQAKESKALMDAQNAKSTNDFKTLEAKMNYVKQIKTEKANAIKNMYDTINSTNKALAQGAHYELYSAFQTLTDPKDKNTFIETVAKNYKVSPMAVVTALQDEQDKRSTADLKTANSKSILANRGKSGGTSSAGISKVQIAQGQQALNKGIDPSTGEKIGNAKGSDGFYDPSVYSKAFEQWPGSAKSFVTAYPIVGGINPKSYKTLPAALQALLPKTSTAKKS